MSEMIDEYGQIFPPASASPFPGPRSESPAPVGPSAPASDSPAPSVPAAPASAVLRASACVLCSGCVCVLCSPCVCVFRSAAFVRTTQGSGSNCCFGVVFGVTATSGALNAVVVWRAPAWPLEDNTAATPTAVAPPARPQVFESVVIRSRPVSVLFGVHERSGSAASGSGPLGGMSPVVIAAECHELRPAHDVDSPDASSSPNSGAASLGGVPLNRPTPFTPRSAERPMFVEWVERISEG
ncbi:hypothetical protein KEM55_008407, partial [Ascosphaera atra]